MFNLSFLSKIKNGGKSEKSGKEAYEATGSNNLGLVSMLQQDLNFAQRRFYVCIFIIICLAISTLCLSIISASKDDKIILVPTLESEYRLSNDDVSVNYIEDMALKIAMIFFNRHPNDGEFYERRAFSITDPVFHSDLRELIETEKRQRFTGNSSQIFRITHMNTSIPRLVVELHGMRETIIDGSVEKREQKIYEIQFVRRGWQLKMSDLKELQRGTSLFNTGEAIRD